MAQPFDHDTGGVYLLKKIPDILFSILCFLTGQYVTSKKSSDYTNKKKKCLLCSFITVSFFITLFSLVVNTFPLAFHIYIIWKCPFTNCSYIPFDDKKPDEEGSGKSVDKYEDFRKFVFTSASVSGTLSFFLMICVIYSQFRFSCNITKTISGCMRGNCDTPPYQDGPPPQANDNSILQSDCVIKLDPFIWYRRQRDPKQDHTLLMCSQVLFFYFLLLLNISLFAASLVTFYVFYSQTYDPSEKLKYFDIVGLSSQFYSWFCAILSCFIFSKVAYAVRNVSMYKLFPTLDAVAKLDLTNMHAAATVTNTVERVMNCFKSDRAKQHFQRHIESKEEIKYLDVLSSIDQLYSFILKDSLQPYGTWFAIHWLTYTLTAFLSVAYVIQDVRMELYEDKNSCHGEHNTKCRLSLACNMLFSVSHCLLFLYPCFRAAVVTSTRYVLIRKVSAAYWPEVPLDQKQAFIQYLKDNNCTFKVSIMCAQIDFGFNITFFSIFIGIMGVVLKLSL